MDYERKELVDWIRGIYQNLDEADKKDALRFFPELRESEDERIRKSLINFLSSFELMRDDATFRKGDFDLDAIKGYISYLEKQKDAFENGRQLGIMQEQARQELEWPDEKQEEQKPINSFDIVPYIDEKIAALQDMWREEKVAFDWDDMHEMIEDVARHFYQKEQKPDIELIQRSWYMEGYYDREFGKEPKWILKTGEGGPKYELNPRHGYYIKDEQKSAEYDDIKKIVLEDFGLCDNGYDPMNVLMTIKRKWPMVWKTMLANESANAKPVEWSEEDEKNWRLVLNEIKDCELRCWFYSVWERLTYHKPHWKPSTEQISMVTRVCNGLHMQNNPDAEGMDELLRQLEKL